MSAENKKSQIPFNGTPEQEKELRGVIEKYREIQGALMPVLQEAQGIYGYLPIEVQQIISEELNIPLAEIFGVVTFYSQFSITPKGRNVISVCQGTACYVKGAKTILEAVENQLGIKVGETTADGAYSIQDTRCLGCCGLAPVMVINESVYGKLTPDAIKGILAAHK